MFLKIQSYVNIASQCKVGLFNNIGVNIRLLTFAKFVEFLKSSKVIPGDIPKICLSYASFLTSLGLYMLIKVLLIIKRR